jgi:hypothetical protein
MIFLCIRYRVKISQSYDVCCNPCKKTKDPIKPIGNEDVPLKELDPLPLYTSSYRQSHQLYPPSD